MLWNEAVLLLDRHSVLWSKQHKFASCMDEMKRWMRLVDFVFQGLLFSCYCISLLKEDSFFALEDSTGI